MLRTGEAAEEITVEVIEHIHHIFTENCRQNTHNENLRSLPPRSLPAAGKAFMRSLAAPFFPER
jgi:hypothetical protein